MKPFGEHNCPPFIIILFVYFLIFGEFILFVYFFLPAYYQQYGSITFILLTEFVILYIILHISFIQCQRISPGHSPTDLIKHYNPQTLEEIKARTKKHNQILNNIRRKKLLKQKSSKLELPEENDEEENFDIIEAIQLVSYCFKCNNIKLPRTHHCKECKKCILRMDHHCPWVNNCIGLKNHRYFCHFLFYASSCLVQCTYFIAADNLLYDGIVSQHLNANARLLTTICSATSFALTVALTSLLAFHLIHIGRNITTVEFHIKEIFVDNPFRKPTFCENFKEVFGEEKLYWFLPIQQKFYSETSPRQQQLFEVEM